MKIPNKRLMAYLSYPFSKDPKRFTEEACQYARKIMEKHPNIFIIVPHTAVDITMFGLPKDNMILYDIKDHVLAPQLEFTILSKIDVFIRGVPDNPSVSMGCMWESAFVQWLNTWRKRKVIIIDLKDILRECEE
jgi:hypothetical protein